MQDEIDTAVAALDRALEDRPDHIHEDLSEAMRCVVVLRDRLIEMRRRGGAPDERLDRVNAALSQMVAAEYPLQGVRRKRIAQARDELAELRAQKTGAG